MRIIILDHELVAKRLDEENHFHLFVRSKRACR
jgi:hypothetical protein